MDEQGGLPDPREGLIAKLTEESKALSNKLNIAYAFIELLRTGFDALLYHNINYQTLPEYKTDSPLNDLEKRPLPEVKVRALRWMAMVKNGIDAAVRRKNFKVH
jgi:hypothetical protein